MHKNNTHGSTTTTLVQPASRLLFPEARAPRRQFCLENYDVSPITGFLPEHAPVTRLPSEFNAWEDLVADLPALIHTGEIRSLVYALPLLNVSWLQDVPNQRRAYSVLGFLAHAYIWSPPEACDQLPANLAEPLLALSEELGMPPLATYGGLCLWNFRLLSASEDPSVWDRSNLANPQSWDLSNLATIQTFTGEMDESWFYLISVALEKQGGPCLANGMGALEACKKGDVADVVDRLNQLAQDISKMTEIFMRMPEKMKPAFFYHRLRPYLAGSKGMEAAGLPFGVRYGNENEFRQYCGGSNGQSSLIQALDVLLNVKHHATAKRQPPLPLTREDPPFMVGGKIPPPPPKEEEPKSNPFLNEMRDYMPRRHREFLVDLEKHANLRPFVIDHSRSNPEVVEAYDGALQALREFRSKHIQIVMRYISLQARSAQSKGIGLSKSNGETGTGGTELMPFLKQTRDEVSDVAAGSWGRNLMSSKRY